MSKHSDEIPYYHEGILPPLPHFPDGVEVYAATDVHSLARALVRYTDALEGEPKHVADLIHGKLRGLRVHHPVVLDTLWHFATVGRQDLPYWQAYVTDALLHHRVCHQAEQLALIVGLPMLVQGRNRHEMIQVFDKVPGVDLNRYEVF